MIRVPIAAIFRTSTKIFIQKTLRTSGVKKRDVLFRWSNRRFSEARKHASQVGNKSKSNHNIRIRKLTLNAASLANVAWCTCFLTIQSAYKISAFLHGVLTASFVSKKKMQ